MLLLSVSNSLHSLKQNFTNSRPKPPFRVWMHAIWHPCWKDAKRQHYLLFSAPPSNSHSIFNSNNASSAQKTQSRPRGKKGFQTPVSFWDFYKPDGARRGAWQSLAISNEHSEGVLLSHHVGQQFKSNIQHFIILPSHWNKTAMVCWKCFTAYSFCTWKVVFSLYHLTKSKFIILVVKPIHHSFNKIVFSM